MRVLTCRASKVAFISNCHRSIPGQPLQHASRQVLIGIMGRTLQLVGRLWLAFLVLSALFAVFFAAVWICSVRQPETITWRSSRWIDGPGNHTVTYTAHWDAGYLSLRREEIIRLIPAAGGDPGYRLPPLGWEYEVDRNRRLPTNAFPAVRSEPADGLLTRDQSPVGSFTITTHAAYPLALFLAVPAIILYWRLVCHPPLKDGHCVCGHDIRATPDGCPKCGLRFPK